MRTLRRQCNQRQTRSTALVARELDRYGIDIAALSEMHLADSGQLVAKAARCKFFWQRPPSSRSSPVRRWICNNKTSDCIQTRNFSRGNRVISVDGICVCLFVGKFCDGLSVHMHLQQPIVTRKNSVSMAILIRLLHQLLPLINC